MKPSCSPWGLQRVRSPKAGVSSGLESGPGGGRLQHPPSSPHSGPRKAQPRQRPSEVLQGATHLSGSAATCTMAFSSTPPPPPEFISPAPPLAHFLLVIPDSSLLRAVPSA